MVVDSDERFSAQLTYNSDLDLIFVYVPAPDAPGRYFGMRTRPAWRETRSMIRLRIHQVA